LILQNKRPAKLSQPRVLRRDAHVRELDRHPHRRHIPGQVGTALVWLAGLGFLALGKLHKVPKPKVRCI
jgi:hypothetical protein